MYECVRSPSFQASKGVQFRTAGTMNIPSLLGSHLVLLWGGEDATSLGEGDMVGGERVGEVRSIPGTIDRARYTNATVQMLHLLMGSSGLELLFQFLEQ